MKIQNVELVYNFEGKELRRQVVPPGNPNYRGSVKLGVPFELKAYNGFQTYGGFEDIPWKKIKTFKMALACTLISETNEEDWLIELTFILKRSCAVLPLPVVWVCSIWGLGQA